MDDENKLTISEPRKFKEKLIAILQNIFEILTVLTIILVGRCMPSYISLYYSLITYLSLIPTIMANKQRISLGLIFSIFNLLVMAIIILFKIR